MGWGMGVINLLCLVCRNSDLVSLQIAGLFIFLKHMLSHSGSLEYQQHMIKTNGYEFHDFMPRIFVYLPEPMNFGSIKAAAYHELCFIS